MEIPKYLEILLKNNSGIQVSEKDYSIYNITQFYNRLSLVIGSSRIGPPNLPVLCVSPENFEDIYGKQDLFLERKNSFFHRTVKDMLKESPVICLNLRPWDRDLDKYNWLNISTSSDNQNSKNRSNSVIDFYNTADGFWRRSSDDFLNIVKDNLPAWKTNPLNFVNQKDKSVSILMFKSDIKGFDIPVEDWYNGQFPEWLHPKDLISDYIIQVIAVEGRWNNYDELSKSNIFSKFFNNFGIKKDKINDFLNFPTVKLLKRWNVSLIPYFRDKQGNDMFIQTVINDDVNETGLLCSYDTEIIETDYINGLIDVLGDNLTKNKKPEIDFLSYKKFLTDFFILEETQLDSPNNAFGNHEYNFKGRTQIYAEGYVYNAKLKPIIISTTSTIEVKPFDAELDAYGVINGKIISITSDISDLLPLFNLLVPNSHRSYLILLTEKGIQFRLGDITILQQNLFLPQIDATKEIVLGYYELVQDINLNYFTKFYSVTLDENGFVNPFRVGLENISKISFKPTSFNWIQEIYFEKVFNPNPQDYNELRIYHLWYWLSNNLQEGKSLIQDINGLKQQVDWIEQGNDGVGKFIKIAIKDKTADIFNTSGTNSMISYYIQDIEFLSKNKKWDYNKPPLYFGTKGIIGYESFIKESYLRGDVNSGDPFFWSFSEETNVKFIFASDINQNLIIIPNGPFSNNYRNKKVIVEGTKYNDGIFNFLDVIIYNGNSAIVVKEDITEEEVDFISIYDAEFPYIINLYDKSGFITALVEIWDGSPEELYNRLKLKDSRSVWAKTLEIKKLQNSNQIIVDWERYVDKLDLGFYLLSDRVPLTDNTKEKVRNWTRIIDLQKLNDTDLLVTTDSSIRFRMIDDTIQTDILKPIWEWVQELDFKVIEGFKPREEVFPDGSDERMNQILNLIAEGTKMQESLSGDKFEWRYLIDSFGGGNQNNSKEQLAQLCLKKKFALGLINVPSIKYMRKDGTKYITDGRFDTQKFLGGGDRKRNTGGGYSLANLGSTHVIYLSPWVSVFENGRFNIVPPASHVGQIFMRKHNDVNTKVWDVLAGIQTSRITTIRGLEERFTDDELNDFHNFGITCLTNFENIIFYLFNEKTAVIENSTLRFTHNREALIELELSLYKGLREVQWNFFTETLKVDVEKIANDICEYYRLNNAIQNYKNEFILDNELIDAQIGLLNTNIELSGAMQTILLRVSILKTGGISILPTQNLI